MDLATKLYVATLCHGAGDFMFQSSWMASQKTRSHLPALLHVAVYGTIFAAVLHPSLLALAVIVGTHFLIDRYRLARYACWASGWLAPWRRELRSSNKEALQAFTQLTGMSPLWWVPPNKKWSECSRTGYDPAVPAHMSDWLLILVDNLIHLSINAAALAWL